MSLFGFTLAFSDLRFRRSSLLFFFDFDGIDTMSKVQIDDGIVVDGGYAEGGNGNIHRENVFVIC